MLPSITKPSQGLLLYQDKTWYFSPGIKKPKPTILIQDIWEDVSSKNIIKGHVTFRKFSFMRQTLGLQHVVAHHVKAASLHSLNPPTLINHHKLSPTDK